MTLRKAIAVLLLGLTGVLVHAASEPVRARRGMVVSQNEIASRVGVDVLREGGHAVDAAVATALVLAVTHPHAGNVGGGGFLVYRPASGEPVAYDFREVAPAGSSPTMFLTNGEYDFDRHHNSHLSVGVPGTVAGLHLAWSEQGRLPWKRLVEPAIALARDGFTVTDGLARSLKSVRPQMEKYPASLAQFSNDGAPYEAGDVLRQPDLARTLERIAEEGPAGFYEGETALLIEREMKANGGLITREDLSAYQARKRTPIRGTYRGYEIISMPPISSGGAALVEMLNILEGYARGLRIWIRCDRSPCCRVDAASLRRPGALPRRSRVQPADADRSTDLEGVRRRAATVDPTGSGVDVVSGNLRLAVGGP